MLLLEALYSTRYQHLTTHRIRATLDLGLRHAQGQERDRVINKLPAAEPNLALFKVHQPLSLTKARRVDRRPRQGVLLPRVCDCGQPFTLVRTTEPCEGSSLAGLVLILIPTSIEQVGEEPQVDTLLSFDLRRIPGWLHP